jgi:hypothetical membrane protein
MPTKLVIVGVFLVVVCALLLHAFPVPPASTPEQRTTVVALTRNLERDPFASNADATRQWLLDWIVEVPDISVPTCSSLLPVDDRYRYSRELDLQMKFAAAAFVIEHQDRARNEIAGYTAGVEGALRLYEVLIATRPDARLTGLDDLVAKRERHQLVEHIARLAEQKCKRSRGLWIFVLLGAGVGLLLALFVDWWFPGRPVHGSTAAPTSAAASSGLRVATICRRIVVVCAAYYMIVGIALHFLEPDFDPRYRFMSEYAWSAHGWLMTTTFFVLGLAILAAALAIRKVHVASRSSRIGFGLLAVGAVFVCLAGVFKLFILHSVASAVGLPSLSAAIVLLSWDFRQTMKGHGFARTLLVIALAVLAAFLSTVSNIGLPGLQQRFFLFLVLVWLSAMAHGMVLLAKASQRDSACS